MRSWRRASWARPSPPQIGTSVDGLHFNYAGGRLRSLLSLISYLGSGEYKDHFLGLKIPRNNLPEEQLVLAAVFADQLAHSLVAASSTNG